MHDAAGLVTMLIPVVAILMPVAIVGIVFWFKARKMQMELHQSLRLREFEHQQRLKELELEIEKTKARNPERVV
jgi:hypothetical protein